MSQISITSPTRSAAPAVIKFKVTDEDILLGSKGKARTCALSRAVSRALFLEGVTGLNVSTTFSAIRLLATDHYTDHYTEVTEGIYPHEYSAWVQKWDAGFPVEPFEGEITKVARKYI